MLTQVLTFLEQPNCAFSWTNKDLIAPTFVSAATREVLVRLRVRAVTSFGARRL